MPDGWSRLCNEGQAFMGISLPEAGAAWPQLASGASAMTAILEEKIRTAAIRVFSSVTLSWQLHVSSLRHRLRRLGSYRLPGRHARSSSPDRTLA